MLYNNAVQIKRDILYRTAKALINDDFDSLNRIPLEAAPRDRENIRCCIHKDRAVLKYRVMAALGFSIEDEIDELKNLSDYAKESKSKPDNKILTVIHDACSSCKLGHHYISDVCQGCVARPCMSVCPKNAVSSIHGRAVINKSLCIDCGKCIPVCPYNAVVKVPVPCEISCPVDALKKGSDGVAQIDESICISCGKCIKSCPFGAIADRSQMSGVLKVLKSKTTVNALIAPSIVGQFPGSLNQIKETLLELGYSAVIEVANFASVVAKDEAGEFLEHDREVMTSSCCPAYIECSIKHASVIKPYVSTSLSPMLMAGRDIKEKNPESINVFIGPCSAKKIEAMKSDYIDFVLSFEELGAHIMAAGSDVLSFDKKGKDSINKIGYGFAESGGVLKGVTQNLRDRGVWITGDSINGIDKKIVKKLKMFDKIPKSYEFLEIMACEGGCMNGPGVIVSSKTSGKVLDSLKKD